MDELKLKLYTQQLRGIVSILVAKAIRKKTGHEVYVRINDISIETENGKIKIHIDADGEINQDDVTKILKNVYKNM